MPDKSQLPGAQTDRWDWQLAAACRTTATEFFHPEDERSRSRTRFAREAAAKQLCNQCSVRRACLQFALSTREPYGIWGGYNPSEREALRQQLQTA